MNKQYAVLHELQALVKKAPYTYTQSDLGRILGISRQRISQVMTYDIKVLLKRYTYGAPVTVFAEVDYGPRREPVANLTVALKKSDYTHCPKCSSHNLFMDYSEACEEVKCLNCGYVLATRVTDPSAYPIPKGWNDTRYKKH